VIDAGTESSVRTIVRSTTVTLTGGAETGTVTEGLFRGTERRAPMRWIEDLFGISPDGGSGLTELLIALALVLVIAAGCILMNVFGSRSALRRILRRDLRD
jgi:hypothetical protein